MIIQERLEAAFQQFGWVRIPETLHAHAEEAAKHNLTYLEFLDRLLQEELAAKHDRYLKTRTRLAKLPYHKTMEQFDFEFQPSIDERRMRRDLATLRFVEHQENVILLGPPGVGKTHLAVAMAMEAIAQRKTVYFTSAHDLVQTLQDAHHNHSIQQKMRVYTKPDLPIIDEIGYRKMDETAAHFFFQIVSERYEKGSIILTSNKSFGMWGDIFGDTVLATAILDRLLHHSSTINIKSESYRVKEKKKKQDSSGQKTPRIRTGSLFTWAVKLGNFQTAFLRNFQLM